MFRSSLSISVSDVCSSASGITGHPIFEPGYRRHFARIYVWCTNMPNKSRCRKNCRRWNTKTEILFHKYSPRSFFKSTQPCVRTQVVDLCVCIHYVAAGKVSRHLQMCCRLLYCLYQMLQSERYTAHSDFSQQGLDVAWRRGLLVGCAQALGRPRGGESKVNALQVFTTQRPFPSPPIRPSTSEPTFGTRTSYNPSYMQLRKAGWLAGRQARDALQARPPHPGFPTFCPPEPVRTFQ